MSIIQDDGGLRLILQKENVTWFSFLQASRVPNSNEGGWNSRTYWVKRGLELLCRNKEPEEFVTEWTKSSLASKAKPLPRTKNFMLRERKAAAVDGRRGKNETPARGTENALNWSIFLKTYTGSDMTYELPLAADKSGQLRADLVVFSKTGKCVEIIELKENIASGTPLMALTESICYALQLLRCWEALKPEVNNVFEIKFDILNKIHLVLAAPDYWDRCKPGGPGVGAINNEDISKLRAIVAAVGDAITNNKENLPKPEISLTLAEVSAESTLKQYEGCPSDLPDDSIVSAR